MTRLIHQDTLPRRTVRNTGMKPKCKSNTPDRTKPTFAHSYHYNAHRITENNAVGAEAADECV